MLIPQAPRAECMRRRRRRRRVLEFGVFVRITAANKCKIGARAAPSGKRAAPRTRRLASAGRRVAQPCRGQRKKMQPGVQPRGRQRHQRALAASADNPSPGVSQFHARQFRTRQCKKGGSRVIFPAANSAFGRAHRHRKCGKSRELHDVPNPLPFF